MLLEILAYAGLMGGAVIIGYHVSGIILRMRGEKK